jgi:hypothetical protein
MQIDVGGRRPCTPRCSSSCCLKMPEITKFEADWMPPHPGRLVTSPSSKFLSSLHSQLTSQSCFIRPDLRLSQSLHGLFREDILAPVVRLGASCTVCCSRSPQNQDTARTLGRHQSNCELRNVLFKEQRGFHVSTSSHAAGCLGSAATVASNCYRLRI